MKSALFRFCGQPYNCATRLCATGSTTNLLLQLLEFGLENVGILLRLGGGEQKKTGRFCGS